MKQMVETREINENPTFQMNTLSRMDFKSISNINFTIDEQSNDIHTSRDQTQLHTNNNYTDLNTLNLESNSAFNPNNNDDSGIEPIIEPHSLTDNGSSRNSTLNLDANHNPNVKMELANHMPQVHGPTDVNTGNHKCGLDIADSEPASL